MNIFFLFKLIIEYPNSCSPERKPLIGINNEFKHCESFDSKEDPKEFDRLNNLVEKLLRENKSLTDELNSNKKLLASAI